MITRACDDGEGLPNSNSKLEVPEFRILYQDAHIVAIDKPSGFHVHAPEDGWRIPFFGEYREF